LIYLLDANVLIALIDPDHVHSAYAKAWFESTVDEGWATCPMTENAFVRIAGKPSYKMPGTFSDMADLLVRVCGRPGHVFWPDSISLVSNPLIDTRRIAGHGQIADVYLLALAVQNGGKLATFDRRIAASAVRGGTDALLVIESLDA
jgi:hypothetical protein